jgi:hypothetical protein
MQMPLGMPMGLHSQVATQLAEIIMEFLLIPITIFSCLTTQTIEF